MQYKAYTQRARKHLLWNMRKKVVGKMSLRECTWAQPWLTIRNSLSSLFKIGPSTFLRVYSMNSVHRIETGKKAGATQDTLIELRQCIWLTPCPAKQTVGFLPQELFSACFSSPIHTDIILIKLSSPSLKQTDKLYLDFNMHILIVSLHTLSQ